LIFEWITHGGKVENMTRERALGWCGLLLIGLIGVAYRAYDWLVSALGSEEQPRPAPRLPANGK
jgi:hypothetical protein